MFKRSNTRDFAVERGGLAFRKAGIISTLVKLLVTMTRLPILPPPFAKLAN